MKTTIILSIAILLLMSFHVQAQDVNDNLNNAGTAYNSGDLNDSRFALQEALNGVNEAIGQDILALMPTTMGNMTVVEGSDNVTGANIGFAGLYVNREYAAEAQDATFDIVSDSPIIGSISSLLTMSVLFASDPNQKRIKIDKYKALLTRSESEEGIVSYEVQLPFGTSLMTFHFNGFDDEDEIISMLNTIPVAEIMEVAQ